MIYKVQPNLGEFKDTRKNINYFRNYIMNELRSIETFEKKKKAFIESKDIKSFRIVSMMLANKYENLLSAYYSRGCDFKQILDVACRYISNLLDAGKFSISDTITGLSMIILLRIPMDRPEIKLFTDTVLKEYGDLKIVKEMVYYIKTKEFGIVKGQDTGFDAIDNLTRILHVNDDGEFAVILNRYMTNEWYASQKKSAYYDSHLKNDNTYHGYWSFFAAAIVAMKIDDMNDNIMRKISESGYIPVALI